MTLPLDYVILYVIFAKICTFVGKEQIVHFFRKRKNYWYILKLIHEKMKVNRKGETEEGVSWLIFIERFLNFPWRQKGDEYLVTSRKFASFALQVQSLSCCVHLSKCLLTGGWKGVKAPMFPLELCQWHPPRSNIRNLDSISWGVFLSHSLNPPVIYSHPLLFQHDAPLISNPPQVGQHTDTNTNISSSSLPLKQHAMMFM